MKKIPILIFFVLVLSSFTYAEWVRPLNGGNTTIIYNNLNCSNCLGSNYTFIAPYLYNISNNVYFNVSPLNALFYPLLTNPAGYLTSYTETDSIWISQKGNYYNKSEIDNLITTINNTEISNLTLSKFFNKTTITYNASLNFSIITGYMAGNNICNAQFNGSHLCDMSEIAYTIQTQNLSNIPEWSGTIWYINGAAKYSPADLPVNDCNGFKHGVAGSYLGNWWVMNQTTGGIGATGHCGNSISLGCCK